MSNKLKSILTLLLFLLSISAYSQDDKNKKQEQDPYKEFSLTSFEDAAAVKIKDSSIIRQHLIGAKWGFGISNVAFSNSSDHKSINTYNNYGIYYTYFHSLWSSMPFFGIQTGIQKTEIGYNHITYIDETNFTEQEQRYSAIEIPLLSMFRVDFWKLRLMLGLGCFGSYITSTSLPDGIPSTTHRKGYGVMGQFGVAIKFNPIEFHIEGGYKYALSNFYDTQIYSKEYWTYTNYNQIFISAGIFFNLSSRKYKK
jgi:hypothetical protein